MKKEELLRELSSNTYLMLKASPIEGIGVFAIRDIPRGCRDMFGHPDAPDDWTKLTKTEVEKLPAAVRFMVENYCLYDAEHYFAPANGFKKMDLALFLNHADAPNIVSINDGDHFEALRLIRAGEELLIDYGQIVEKE